MKFAFLMIVFLSPSLTLARPAKRGVMSKIAYRGARRTAPDSPTPPYYYKPGALIRTGGQLPVYSDPKNPTATPAPNGTTIALDPRQAQDVGRAPGVFMGKPDTLPGKTAQGGAGSGSSLFGGQ